MTKWLLLAAAIVTEVTASLSLRAAIDHAVLYVVVVLGYVASFSCLAGVLRRGLPLGVAYGVWGALGVALTAVLSVRLFGEAITPVMWFGMALVVAGVVLVELGSHSARRHGSRSVA
ncbi:MAG TPA: SMR family transporter [Nocardioides sp.]|uniref:DMT family transporter n=1 Tax=Nocardioides sp. TaxID=35761 RepID=UPI002D802676|nr:SMR family transporter [Nocardioides sp.]HET6651309.1 SMR family transporter [Nocardioides sp.]